jgi:hypothetical protein
MASLASFFFNPQNVVRAGRGSAERAQPCGALRAMSMGVKAYLQNRLADRDIDPQSRGSGLQCAFEFRVACIGKPHGFEAFGLVVTIDETG